jgi:hypothetical protein
MESLSSLVLLSSPSAEWQLPLLGVLLTGLGVLLLSASMGETGLPAFPAGSAASSTVAVATMPGRVTSVATARSVASRAWGGVRPGSGAAVLAVPGWSRGPGGCLGTDLATGRRAESAHLATVALQRPADCGDLSDVITATAALARTSRAREATSHPTGVATDPRPAEGIDLVVAALYGPPDRQPQATLEEEVLDGGRGRERDYLEQTAASRMLVP